MHIAPVVSQHENITHQERAIGIEQAMKEQQYEELYSIRVGAN